MITYKYRPAVQANRFLQAMALGLAGFSLTLALFTLLFMYTTFFRGNAIEFKAPPNFSEISTSVAVLPVK